MHCQEADQIKELRGFAPFYSFITTTYMDWWVNLNLKQIITIKLDCHQMDSTTLLYNFEHLKSLYFMKLCTPTKELN